MVATYRSKSSPPWPRLADGTLGWADGDTGHDVERRAHVAHHRFDVVGEAGVVLDGVHLGGPPGEPRGAGAGAELEHARRATALGHEEVVDPIDRSERPPGGVQLEHGVDVVDRQQRSEVEARCDRVAAPASW